MDPNGPEQRLISDRLYIIKRLTELSGFSLLLGYDIEESAQFKQPVYRYVRMVHPGHEWSADYAKEDSDRDVVVYKGHTFVLLERANVSGEGPLTFIEEEQLVFFMQIGSGGQGVVYFGHDMRRPDSPFVAVKQLTKPRSEAEEIRQEREATLHTRACINEHPNIVFLRRSFQRLGSRFLVMDFHFGGDLFSDIQHNAEDYLANDDLVRELMIQLIDVVRYLHGEHIYHCDIKPENIMISSDRKRILLTDFGFSSDEDIVWKEGKCGTDAYVSPETWVNAEISSASKDAWAIAMTSLFVALCGRLPWRRALPRSELYREVDLLYDEFAHDPHVLRQRLPISKEFEDLLLIALNPDSRGRMNLRALRDGFAQVSHFLMPDEELREAEPEAQRVALIMGFAELPTQSDSFSDEDCIGPLLIHEVTHIDDPDSEGAVLHPIPYSEDLSGSVFAEANPILACFAELAVSSGSLSSSVAPGLGSHSLSGETVFDPVTPENFGVVPDPTVVGELDSIPSIDGEMGGGNEEPAPNPGLPKVLDQSRTKQREPPVPPSRLAPRVQIIRT